jgi:hypothetical protein
MFKRTPLGLAGVAAAVLATLAACGPSAGTPTGGTDTSAPAGSTATSAATTAAQGLTPQQVCGLVSLDDAARIAGFPMTATQPETSGDVAVCHYQGTLDDYTSSKVIIEYQPSGKAAVEYTKNNGGEAVAGLGQAAYWFDSSKNLAVELGADAVLGIYIEDVRFHQNNPKDGAQQLATLALTHLPIA